MASQEGINQDQTVDAGVDVRLQTHSILDTVAADHELSKLADAFRHAGMEGYLNGPDLVTLFAPDNGALASLDSRDIDGLATLLRRHMMPGAVTEAELRASKRFKTLEHTEVRVSTDQTATNVGTARIVRADIECTNGVVHVINGVL